MWGATEVTLGSFLHSLRIPFSGVLLASAGAALLIAQRQVLPKRGSAIATGIVAACCKSLSPGGVILGPMVGIIMESLLVEFALLLGPKSPVSAAVAGMLAAGWAASQKVLSHWFFYGSTALDVYVALLQKVAHWLGANAGSVWYMIGVVGVLVATFGALAGLFGWTVGREARGRLIAQTAGQKA